MSDQDTLPSKLTIPELAEHWRVSRETVRALIIAGRLKGSKRYGAQWRIPREAVEQYEAEAEAEAQQH